MEEGDTKAQWEERIHSNSSCQLPPATGHNRGRKTEHWTKFKVLSITCNGTFKSRILHYLGDQKICLIFQPDAREKLSLHSRFQGTVGGKALVHDSVPWPCLFSATVTEGAYWWLFNQERSHRSGKEQGHLRGGREAWLTRRDFKRWWFQYKSKG